MQCLEQEPTGVNDRIITMKKLYALIISAYALTTTNPEETKEGFYSTVRDIVKAVLITDKLIIAGDFNARVGREVENWRGVIGLNGIGKCSSNGEMLLAFSSEF